MSSKLLFGYETGRQLRIKLQGVRDYYLDENSNLQSTTAEFDSPLLIYTGPFVPNGAINKEFASPLSLFDDRSTYTPTDVYVTGFPEIDEQQPFYRDNATGLGTYTRPLEGGYCCAYGMRARPAGPASFSLEPDFWFRDLPTFAYNGVEYRIVAVRNITYDWPETFTDQSYEMVAEPV